MRHIKIRFIQQKDNYTIQRKGWLGWKDISYTIDMGYGSISYCYGGKNKQDLLAQVLEEYYEIDKRFVQVTEYPTLKVY